jgi:hypothetical protein
MLRACERPPGLRLLPVWLLLGLILALVPACAEPTGVLEGKAKPATGPNGKVAPRPAVPPQVKAAISQVKINWKDKQQTFLLRLTNSGAKTEVVHAIVYARNDETNPPRRGISPPTAYDWFKLANSQDGRLTSQNIAQTWRAAEFATARGNRLRKSWDVKIEPETTENVEAAHDLDDTSPHPAFKGKKFASVGYAEYQIWLFTPEGYCFSEETWPAFGPPPEPKKTPEPKTEPKPMPEPKVVVDDKSKDPKPPVDPRIEKLAANELRLALYYLEQNRKQDARDKLAFILKRFPETKAATEARDYLQRIP